MKAKVFVKQLQELIGIHGDLEIVDDENRPQTITFCEGWYPTADPDDAIDDCFVIERE